MSSSPSTDRRRFSNQFRYYSTVSNNCVIIIIIIVVTADRSEGTRLSSASQIMTDRDSQTAPTYVDWSPCRGITRLSAGAVRSDRCFCRTLGIAMDAPCPGQSPDGLLPDHAVSAVQRCLVRRLHQPSGRRTRSQN